jgi:hypothetical protein
LRDIETRRIPESNRTAESELGKILGAQSVFDPELIAAVLRELMEDVAGDPSKSLARGMKGRNLEPIDSSLWEVLPRMGWAHWWDQFSTKQNAVRLHLRCRLFELGAGGTKLVAARECERSLLRHGMRNPASSMWVTAITPATIACYDAWMRLLRPSWFDFRTIP